VFVLGITSESWAAGGKPFWKRITEVASDVAKAAKGAAEKVGNAFKKAGKTIAEWGDKALDVLKDAAQATKRWVEKQGRKISFLWKNIMPQFPDPGIRFRLPMEDPREFDSRVVWGVDTLLGKLGGAICRDYRGRWGLLFCYGDHEGTDYRLRGGFASMDRGKGWVVAAAGGRVTMAEHHHFDRCTAFDLKAFFTKGAVGVTCKGEKFDGSKHEPNQVILEHTPTLRTRYFHLRKGSIPWLARYREAAKKNTEFRLKCGDRIGTAGSSGLSSFPHLHFQVERKNEKGHWVTVAPYRGKYSQSYSYWVSERGSGGFPSTGCQK
jgi:murein DD-endopeptidase MepM/ murein hydrolase activator NlpD